MAERRDESSRGVFPTGSSTSTSLLLRLREGDQQAWDRMVELYYPLAFGWCRTARIPSQDIVDVLQETFRAVANSLDRFRKEKPQDTFRGWLHGVTSHKVRDYWRKRAKTPDAFGASDSTGLFEAIPDVTDESSGSAPKNELAWLVQNAALQLKETVVESTWQSFWRTVVDGENPSDVAADLGISVNAVYRAKSRLLKRLREELGDLDGIFGEERNR